MEKEMVQLLVFNQDEKQKIKIKQFLYGDRSELYQVKFAEKLNMKIFDHHYYDLILVNQSGAGNVGLAYIAKIKSLQTPIPIIFITRGNSLSVDKHAMELGASDCLPIDSLTKDSLERSIRHVLFRKNREAKLSFLATHDPLTGLSNRYLFQEHLVRSIDVSKRRHTAFGLMLLDLDRFKMVNDSLGHDIGDLLLKEVALRIKSAVRAVDLVARFGGDEFTILIDDINDKEELSIVAEKVQQSLLPVMNLHDQEVFVTTSIGISYFPECGIEPLTLIKSADIAMYKAKELGRNKYYVYSNDLSEESRLKLVLERDLRKALIRGEFELFYQPQFDVKTNEISGAEALLRWRHQTLGIILPDKFIPLLEEMGMMIGVEQWVLRQVCYTAKLVNSTDFFKKENDKLKNGGIKFSINISGSHFKQGDLAHNVKSAIEDIGVNASYIEIELTEDIMIEHVEKNNAVLNLISSMGVSIALDDFGKGYSSLTYLKNFPADILKIDKAFIDNLAVEGRDSAIVSSMIDLSHKLSIKVVAEGVEEPEQAEILKKEGCDYIQGFLYAKPMPVDQFLDFLKNDGIKKTKLRSIRA
ncbi:MAG: diguanylate cyclase (GGDEF)-like protein [Polaribacter sp.]